jgi:hypothetical protein
MIRNDRHADLRPTAERRWPRLLPERIPGVSFARIKFPRDARAAAARPRPSPALDTGTAVNGMFLHRNSAPRKRSIRALRLSKLFCTFAFLENVTHLNKLLARRTLNVSEPQTPVTDVFTPTISLLVLIVSRRSPSPHSQPGSPCYAKVRFG